MVISTTITLSTAAHSLLEYLLGQKNDGTSLSGAAKTFPHCPATCQRLTIQALGNGQAIYQGGSSEVASTNSGFTYPVVTSPSMTVYTREAAVGRNPIELSNYWLVASSSTPAINVTVEVE